MVPPAFTPDLDALRLAVALADAGTLAAAGAALGLGKRTATARIAQLERSLGAVLFDHAGRAVRLTPAGEAFVGEARLALAALGRAGRLAREVAARPAAIAFGATPDALLGPVRTLMEDPAWAEAQFAPVLHILSPAAQAAALAEGRIAAGFLNPPVPAVPRLAHLIVGRCGWSAVVPDGEARLRKTASVPALARKPLVMLDQAAAPLAVDGLVAALAATGVPPVIAQSAPDWAAVIALVALGLGSALVPSLIAKRLTIAGATVLPLTEAADLPPWTTHAVWLPPPPGSRAADAVAIIRRLAG